MSDTNYSIEPIGVIRSELTSLEAAPMQGDEGAPAAWIDLTPSVAPGLVGLNVGDELIVLTWLHRAARCASGASTRQARGATDRRVRNTIA
jgi:tRNA (Thr-GGU) A37 N-methylase